MQATLSCNTPFSYTPFFLSPTLTTPGEHITNQFAQSILTLANFMKFFFAFAWGSGIENGGHVGKILVVSVLRKKSTKGPRKIWGKSELFCSKIQVENSKTLGTFHSAPVLTSNILYFLGAIAAK